MKITFTWNPFFITKKSPNNFYYLNFEGYDFYDKLTKYLIENNLYADFFKMHHDFFLKCNFTKVLQFKTQTSIYDGIIDTIINFIDYIESLDLKANIECNITFNIAGDEYIEKIIQQICWNDFVFIKKEKFGHNIPYLENKLKEHTKKFLNQYAFDFDRFLAGTLSTGGGETFVFECCLTNIKAQIKEFELQTEELIKLGEKKHKLIPSYYLNFKWLNDWLLGVEHNIINFLSITSFLLIEIKNSVSSFGSKKINFKLITSSRIWNSLLFELFKPKYMDNGVKSFTNVFKTIKNQKLVTMSPNIFDYIYGKGLENKFTTEFMNKWIKKLLEIRNRNFHLSSEKEIFDEDYLLIYLSPYGRLDIKNINKTIDFIISVEELVLSCYCYFWQIFNYLTGSILNTSKNFREYLDQFSSKFDDFKIDESK